MPSFDIGRPGLHLQSGASVVLGGVGELPGSRCTDFNPRTPCGARPDRRPCRPDDGGISIHAPRVGRDNTSPIQLVQTNISIHAPRVGCDAGMRVLRGRGRISIHAPRVGRDEATWQKQNDLKNFNPRAPCGARLQTILLKSRNDAISIHAPRVGRDARRTISAVSARTISIHAPRVGRDPSVPTSTSTLWPFQSTRPVWGATRKSALVSATEPHFNPRAPCGARRGRCDIG